MQPRTHGCVVDTYIFYFDFVLLFDFIFWCLSIRDREVAVWPSSGRFRVTSCCTMQPRTHGCIVDTYIFNFNFVLFDFIF